MRSKATIWIIAAVVCWQVAGRANSLVNIDYKNPGDKMAAIDVITGLEWLNMAVTYGQTVSTALANNPGFSLATPAQLLTMFLDAGGGFTAYDDVDRPGPPDETTATAVVNALGATHISDFGGGLVESDIYSHVLRPNTLTYDMYHIDLRPTAAFHVTHAWGGSAEFISMGNVFGDGSSIESTFLVSVNPVPEPSPFALTAVGALCLAAACLRRRIRAAALRARRAAALRAFVRASA